MSKKHFVLTGIVLTALSVGVASAAPINIVQTGHNIGAEGTTFTNDGNITLGHVAGAANSRSTVLTQTVITSPSAPYPVMVPRGAPILHWAAKPSLTARATTT